MKRLVSVLASLLVAATTCAQCGHERWPIKTGADPDAASVNLTAIDTTIAQLRALTPPTDVRHFHGRAPAELQTYTVLATLTLFKSESDSDYHLVIREAGKTMIAEIPDPSCADGSPWQSAIDSVRTAFSDHFGWKKSKKNLRVKVRITGPAFFDFIHGQTGHAPSGIEIHPVLALEFPQ